MTEIEGEKLLALLELVEAKKGLLLGTADVPDIVIKKRAAWESVANDFNNLYPSLGKNVRHPFPLGIGAERGSEGHSSCRKFS